MIEYLTLLLAIPLGIALAKTTKDEKQLYSNSPYFPIILWVLALAAATFFTLDKTTALTLTFAFITTLTWHKS
jgi:hypothetical protein